jgi:hypothetical protein
VTRAALFAGAVALGSCIPAIPTGPVTAGNAAQVQGCQTTATEHNALVLGGVALGAGASGLSTVTAADAALRTSVPLLVIAAALTGLVTVAGAGAGLTAATFTNGGCGAVVGALPAATATDAGLE